MFTILGQHLTVLSICWIAVTGCTIVFLLVSAISMLPKLRLRGTLAAAGQTLAVTGIFLVASGITAYGSIHPATRAAPAARTVSQETAANPLGANLPANPVVTAPGAPLANDGSGGHVVFTFDDGPGPDTPSVLAELKLLHVPAVFFVIGEKTAERPGIVKAEVAGGDVVGNHTWDHKSLTGKGTGAAPLTGAQVRSELLLADGAITTAGAPQPTLWRPPYGAVSPADITVASSLGLRLVIDSSSNNSITDSEDWAGKTPAQIASVVEASLGDWGGTPSVHGGTRIVAFHDGLTTAPNTVKALPLIVAWMNAHHFGATLTLPADSTGGIPADGTGS